MLADHRLSLGRSITNLRAVTESLRDAKGDLQTLLEVGPGFLHTTADLVAEQKKNLDCILTDLAPVLAASSDAESLDDLRVLLTRGPTAFGYVFNSVDREPDGPWIRVNLALPLGGTEPRLYTPRATLPVVPTISPCASTLEPAALASGAPSGAASAPADAPRSSAAGHARADPPADPRRSRRHPRRRWGAVGGPRALPGGERPGGLVHPAARIAPTMTDSSPDDPADTPDSADTAEADPVATGTRTPVLVLAISLAVLFAIAAAVLAVIAAGDDGGGDGTASLRTAAGTAGEALLTYDFNDPEAHRDRVLALATGSFRGEYEDAFDQGLSELITKVQATSKGFVKDVYVSQIDEERAEAVVVAGRRAGRCRRGQDRLRHLRAPQLRGGRRRPGRSTRSPTSTSPKQAQSRRPRILRRGRPLRPPSRYPERPNRPGRVAPSPPAGPMIPPHPPPEPRSEDRHG